MSYELSEHAASDLEDVFDYTLVEFGLDQAVKYVMDFDLVFARLSDNQKLGRVRGEIRKGLRSVVKENHVVFYRLSKGNIRILRILHGSRDLPKYF